jgi:hypothetical protein
MSGEKRPRHVEVVLRLRGSVGRDKAANRYRVGLPAFKVALKDYYKAI